MRPATRALALYALALAPRLVAALAHRGPPAWDGAFYDAGARSIARGFGYGQEVVIAGTSVFQPSCHYPVGYPALLGLAYRVFGARPEVAALFNASLGALLAVAVYALARHATSERRALIAGALVALHPGLVAYTPLLMTEPTAALAIVVAAWLVARTQRARDDAPSAHVPLAGTLAAGLALGLGTLVRPPTLWCAPALGLFALDGRTGQIKRALVTGALATWVALAVVAPWSVRNCRVMDGCAFVSSNAGWNLAIGAMPRATGRYEPIGPEDGCAAELGQVAQDRCFARLGLAWIADDPWRWVALAPRKLHETFDHESFPIGYLAVSDPERWPEARVRVYRGVLTTWHRLLLFAAALGLVAHPRGASAAPHRPAERMRARLAAFAPLALVLALGALATSAPSHPFFSLALAIPVLAFGRRDDARRARATRAFAAWAVLGVCVTHVVFFGEDRYHMVVSPLLCLLAACAFERGGSGARAVERATYSPSP